MPAGAEAAEGLLVILVFKQRPFAEPVVKDDPDGCQVVADEVDHLGAGDVADAADGGLVGHPQVGVPVGGDDLAGDAGDVIALVAVFRHPGILPQGLLVARPDGAVEGFHLRAGVVDVVLPRDRVARRFQRVGQGAAQHSAAGMAHMDGAGRVDAHEFHHHPPAGAGGGVAESVAGGAHRFHLLLQPFLAEAEVDEPRRRGRYGGDFRAGVHPFRNLLGQPQRIGAGGAGQTQGQVGGEVPVFRVVGPFHLYVRHGGEADDAFPLGPFQRGLQGIGDGVFEQHSEQVRSSGRAVATGWAVGTGWMDGGAQGWGRPAV